MIKVETMSFKQLSHTPNGTTENGGVTSPFSRWLREKRLEAEVTSQEVADLLGITKSAYELYEVAHGRQHKPSRPSHKHLRKLAQALHMSVDELADRCGIPRSQTIFDQIARKQAKKPDAPAAGATTLQGWTPKYAAAYLRDNGQYSWTEFKLRKVAEQQGWRKGTEALNHRYMTTVVLGQGPYLHNTLVYLAPALQYILANELACWTNLSAVKTGD